MYTKTVEVTPQYAAKLLETIANPRNRRFDAKKLDQYQSDMRTPGKWITDTADFIRISKKGILLDGHHRLKAVVLSGTTQRFGFAYGPRKGTSSTGGPWMKATLFATGQKETPPRPGAGRSPVVDFDGLYSTVSAPVAISTFSIV